MNKTSVTILFCGYLLTILQSFEAADAGTYSLSSRVIPHEVRRQGHDQENPCPGDTVEFTCTRSESTPATVRWTANERPLYTFVIPLYIGNSDANQSNRPGLTGTLINATTFKLLVVLNTSMVIVNGSKVACDEVGGNTSQSINMSIIGLSTAPSITSINAVSFTGLRINVTVSEYGSVCVDEYRTVIIIGGTLTAALSISQTVVDPHQETYIFDFTVDTCREVLKSAYATVVASTNGDDGANSTENVTNILNNVAITSQLFITTGIRITLKWKITDLTLDKLNILCGFVESTKPVTCVEIERNTFMNEQIILISYDANIDEERYIALTYSNEICEVYEELNIAVNSSIPKVNQTMEKVTIMFTFNENHFQLALNSSFFVVFSSNCTQQVRVNYTRLVVITTSVNLTDTRVNTGHCQYFIQLMDSNFQQIGYPIQGLFQLDSKSPGEYVTAIAAGVTMAGVVLALLAISIVTIAVIIIIAIKKKKEKSTRIHDKSSNNVMEDKAKSESTTLHKNNKSKAQGVHYADLAPLPINVVEQPASVETIPYAGINTSVENEQILNDEHNALT